MSGVQAGPHSRTALNTSVSTTKAVGAGKEGATASGDASQDMPDPRTTLPPPQVEIDVVNILADFPRQERPYVQMILHNVKDLQALNKQCTRKAAVYAQKDAPKHGRDQIDLADLSKFNQGYLRYFDPLRSYLRISYQRLYAVTPPARFQKAHKYWLGYLAYALENLDQQRMGDKAPARPTHSPVEVTQYRAWAIRLFKENGLDLSSYLMTQ
jgi:hypothetical protein